MGSDFIGGLGQALQSGAQAALSATPHGLSILQGLRATAQQQQDLAERKRQFDMEQALRQSQFAQNQQQNSFSNQLNLLNAGAQPVSPGADGSLTRQLGGIQGQPGQAQPGGSMTLGGGSPTDIPMPAGNAGPPAQMPAPPQIQGQAPGMSQIVAPGVPSIAPSPGQVNPGRVVRPPGGGGSYYIPTQQEAASTSKAAKVEEGDLVPVPEEIRGMYGKDAKIPSHVTPGVLKALTDAYSNISDQGAKQQAAGAKANPPKTTVTTTAQDAKLLGLKEGQELPIDEYKARAQMMAEDARARRDEASARRLDALASKGSGAAAEKPASPTQIRTVRSKFDSTLATSKAQLEKDLKDNLGPDDVREAYRQHIGRMQDAQTAYESELSALMGNKDIPHNDWADKQMTEWQAHATAQGHGQPGQGAPPPAASPEVKPSASAPQAQAKPAAAAPQSQHKVGDVVTYQGKSHKVKSITPEGKLVLEPAAVN